MAPPPALCEICGRVRRPCLIPYDETLPGVVPHHCGGHHWEALRVANGQDSQRVLYRAPLADGVVPPPTVGTPGQLEQFWLEHDLTELAAGLLKEKL